MEALCLIAKGVTKNVRSEGCGNPQKNSKAKPSKKSVDSFGQNGQFGTLFVSGRQNPFWCADLQKGSRKTVVPNGVELWCVPVYSWLGLGALLWSWVAGLLLRRIVAVGKLCFF